MKHVLAKLSKASTAATLTAMTAMVSLVPAALAAPISAISPPPGYALDAGKLINFVLRVVMVIAALLVFLYLIMGGIEWITSGGEKSKTEAARNKITGAVVGLIILASSYAILRLVLSFLGLSNLTDLLNSTNNINQ